MSLSSHTSHEPSDGLEPLSVGPIHHVPALDKKEPEPPAEKDAAEGTPEPTPEPAAEATPDRQEAESAPTPKQPMRWQDIVLDSVLVGMVILVLAGGGYYLHTQWNKYRVPTEIELQNEQCLALCQQREKLQDDYNHADEQLRMRKHLSALDDQLISISRQCAQMNDMIAEQKKMVLALQHEIRRADRDARNVARGLLPGLQVGDVTTTRGKSYPGATISRIEGRRISLRTAYGAASFPVNELVKDNLPDLVLYALGIIELVDMSDFTTTGDAPTTPMPKSPKLRKTIQAPSSTDYEPRSTGPVLDTGKGSSTNSVLPPTGSPQHGGVWQPPTGDLPL